VPDVFMPRLSDTMTEGTIAQWLKHEGEDVRAGDVLAEIETDKATMELEAYDSGVLTRIVAQPGTTVPIGQTIAVIGEPSGDTGSSDTGSSGDAPAGDAAAEPAPITPRVRGGQPAPPQQSRRDGAPVPVVRTSPLARALAREHGLDLSRVTGTGPGGRIVRADVEAAVAADSTSAPRAARPAPPVVAAPADEQLPLSAMRRITAQRLTESAAAPQFYLTSVVDAQPLLALRRELNGALAASGTKLSVTDLLVRACALMLRAHPAVNTSWAGDHLVRHGGVHVGVAVALDEGLIVPVIRDADRKGITEIATEAHSLAGRARGNKLSPDEFSGGTFTISNLGMFGVDHFTAVINPPEAAILAVGAAREEAAVRDGQVVAVTTMKLTMSSDHRVLDGAKSAAFLRDLVDLLEHPLRILL
jgi:pyruvate dehydrogenase E2 component (dihydrolipoamide acetyltransferase)